MAFRDAYKLRAESEIVSRKKKGKVISMIGSDPRLRKLKEDKDITPEEAMLRKEIAAESDGGKCEYCGEAGGELIAMPEEHISGPIVNVCEHCYDIARFGAETKVEAQQECLFCDETDAEFIEVILDGYPELICEYCADPNNWAAENWGGDPEGPLAKALDKARATLKNKLNITKLPHKDQKSLDEFNGAVVWKEPKGIVDKVMVREMAIQQLRLSDAILELEQYIRLGMISEEDAFRKIVAMSQ